MKYLFVANLKKKKKTQLAKHTHNPSAICSETSAFPPQESIHFQLM